MIHKTLNIDALLTFQAGHAATAHKPGEVHQNQSNLGSKKANNQSNLLLTGGGHLDTVLTYMCGSCNELKGTKTTYSYGGCCWFYAVLYCSVPFCFAQFCFELFSSVFVAAGGLTCAKSPPGGQGVMTGTSVPSYRRFRNLSVLSSSLLKPCTNTLLSICYLGVAHQRCTTRLSLTISNCRVYESKQQAQHSAAKHCRLQSSMVQHNAKLHRTAQHSMTEHGTARHKQHSTARHSTAQRSIAQQSTKV